MNALPMSNRSMVERRTPAPPADAWGLGGAIAGLFGGLAMITAAALLAGSYGYDTWFQLKAIASLALGPAAVAQVGFVVGPVLLGLAIHLAVSALLGALFAISTRRILRLPSDFGAPAVSGLVFGLLIWLVAYLAVPALLPQLMAVYAPAFILQHIIYGTVTGLVHARLRPSPYAMAS
jgi:hypothetical protein